MTADVPAGRRSSEHAYAYDTFTTRLILSDLAFHPTDPGPGDSMPAFDLETVGGGRFGSRSLGDRPVLMVFGSLTCPVTESAGPVLRDLHVRYGEHTRFVMVNTREAHPGELVPQPRTYAEKLRHAQALQRHHGFGFEVAVDDIDGTLHRALGPKPNSAYLVGPDGTILYRAHWANDRAGLAAALAAAVSGRPLGRGRSSAMGWPLLKAIGHLPGVVDRAGRKVARDVWRAVPPFGVMAAVSRVFAFLPRDYRGAGAVILLVALGAGATTWQVLG